MSTALVFVHGRAQQLDAALRGQQPRVAAHVEARKREWLAGLAKGLILARRPPVADGDVWFPFYGNAFADLIDEHVAAGGGTPDLELVVGAGASTAAATKERMILEAAGQLGFRAEQELAYADPRAAEQLRDQVAAADSAEEIPWGNLLRVPVAHSALQFLARKTGATEWVIEQFLDDVAYYLEVPRMRDTVLDIVLGSVTEALRDHDDLVLVAHSLGTVVAYDLFDVLPRSAEVRLLVTAGSPLGLPVVQRNLRAAAGGHPGVPRISPAGDTTWLNAYDVRDFVALVHPLRTCFTGGDAAIRDVVTHNPSDPHSIADYLSDPDVASPIGLAASGRPGG